MRNGGPKIAAVAGLLALAWVVVLSGCGWRAKPSTPEEKRFAESARVGIQSVCDMKTPAKECADNLMRTVLAETNTVKRQRLLSFVCDAMASTCYFGGTNYNVRLSSWNRLRAFRDLLSGHLCGQKEFRAALDIWFAEGLCLRREAKFCKAEARKYDEFLKTNEDLRLEFETGYIGNQWGAHARYCLDYIEQGMAAYVLWDDSVAGRYCEGKSSFERWRVARRIKKAISRYPDWYLEQK